MQLLVEGQVTECDVSYLGSLTVAQTWWGSRVGHLPPLLGWFRICDAPGFWAVTSAFNNSLSTFEWESFLLAITKGLVCSTASAGLSLRVSVRSADWCAFWKCFPAKLPLINKIYESKEKLVLPSWGVCGLFFFFVLMTNLHVQGL